jgi:hypothetical protein
MEIKTVADIYESNKRTRAYLRELLSGIADEEAVGHVDGQAWSIAQIVEHISLVAEGSSKVCAKLMKKAQAENHLSNGTVTISKNFMQKSEEVNGVKLTAPEIVQPGSRAIGESLEKMAASEERLESLRPLFQNYDGTTRKFPHPFFGELSAHEWLLLSGYHERRHIEQLKRLLDKD